MIVFGGDYEHTLEMGLTDRDRSAGIIYKPHGTPMDYFSKILNRDDFEVCECSLANYMLFRGNDDDWLIALPVFPIRAFRHGDVVVRKDSKLRDFTELAGRRVGINDYSQTLAVWMRGLLRDEYGLDWRDVDWVAPKKQRFEAPAGAKLTTIDMDVEDALIAGEIDAVIKGPLKDSRKPPEERLLRPLLEDPRKEEIQFFKRTGLFPIRHTVVMRKEAYERDPAAAQAIFNSYVSAKKAAIQRRLSASFVPWGEQSWNDAMSVFNGDSHPYGLTDGNRNQVRLLAGYLLDQGFIARPLDLDSLFVPGSESWRE